jgi:glycosyltransferase involved in cell wall biosynthesis
MNKTIAGADTRDPRKLLSVLVPVYNEEENLNPLYERLDRTLKGLADWSAEIIFIDDGSRDESFTLLHALRSKDPRVKILRMSRNFGSWSAVLAGFHAASGDAVVWMSSDLQDPPELIPQLLRSWDEGAEVVWAVRAERHDPWPRRIMAFLFYKLLRRIALPNYPS